MKVMKGMDKGRPAVPHPKPMGDAALKAGIAQLKTHHAENRRDMPERPEHRRKGS